MILHDLTSSEMAAVEAIGVPMKAGAGEALIREGEAGSSFFLVLNGRVEVRKSIGPDKHKKLVELGPLDPGRIGASRKLALAPLKHAAPTAKIVVV